MTAALPKTMTKAQAEVIIKVLDREFDSHDFICEYIYRFPSSYGELLIKHNNVNSAHAEIANFLRYNSSVLNICKIGEMESADIFGTPTICALWENMSI